MFKFPGRMNNPLVRADDNQMSLHGDSTPQPLRVLLEHGHKSKEEGALAMVGADAILRVPHPTLTVPEIPPLSLAQMQMNAFLTIKRAGTKVGERM